MSVGRHVRIVLLGGLLLSLPTTVTGQMRVEIETGLAASTFHGDQAEIQGVDKGSRTGFHLGANLSIPVADRFHIAPGLAYTQKGATYTDPEGTEETFKLDYFEIPVIGAFTFWSGANDVSLDVFFGPRLSFEASCEEKEEETTETTTQTCPSAELDNRRTTHVGILTGVGVWFPLRERLSIGASTGFDFGLRTLDTSATAPDDIKNRAWFLEVRVGIPLGS